MSENKPGAFAKSTGSPTPTGHTHDSTGGDPEPRMMCRSLGDEKCHMRRVGFACSRGRGGKGCQAIYRCPTCGRTHTE